MPVSHDTLNIVDSSIAAGSVLIAAFSHWAAISTRERKMPKGVLFGNLFGAGLAGLGVFYITDEIIPWTISFVGELFFSGLVGFVWGPLFLFVLASVGQAELAKRLHLDKNAILPLPTINSSNSSCDTTVVETQVVQVPIVQTTDDVKQTSKEDVKVGGEGNASGANDLDNPLG